MLARREEKRALALCANAALSGALEGAARTRRHEEKKGRGNAHTGFSLSRRSFDRRRRRRKGTEKGEKVGKKTAATERAQVLRGSSLRELRCLPPLRCSPRTQPARLSAHAMSPRWVDRVSSKPLLHLGLRVGRRRRPPRRSRGLLEKS